jgi:large subunit ribosomal protein L25
MRKDITIAAEARDTRGKNAARRLRVAGKVPAVLYGAGGPAVAVAVSPKEIGKILNSPTGHNTIFDLALAGGEKTPVMAVEWLNDPVKGNMLHVDLLRIDLTKRIRVMVPVHTTGDPQGVKLQGGMFELITREIEIDCLPDEIPEHFTIDVSAMMIGQSLRAGEVPLLGSMKLLSGPEQVIAHVITIRVVEEVAPVEAVVATDAKTEPEVMKKGKKEEEGAAEDKEKGKKK